jgi:hypothetical protein
MALVIGDRGFLLCLGIAISVAILGLLIMTLSSPQAAYLRNVPVQVTQPNGEALNIFASGDEYYNWLHDKDGYTIIQDPDTGYYVYAIEKDGDLAPSGFIVNRVDPNSLNIEKYLKRSKEKMKKPWEVFPRGSRQGEDKAAK